MKKRLLNLYYKIAYRYFNLYRDKVILCRELVTIVDVKAFYDKLEFDKISSSINDLQVQIAIEKELEASQIAKVTEFQRKVDYATSELMIELVELNRKLNPQTPDLEELKEHYERIKSGQAPETPSKPKKGGGKELKKLKKLYKALAKIYHPDKAPKGREEEYTEIFKTITAFRELGDFRGLKTFARGLKKHPKKGKKPNLKKLKTLRDDLVKQLKELVHFRNEFKQSKVYAEFLEYQRNPNLFINKQIEDIKRVIHNLQQELDMKERIYNELFGNVYTERTFESWE